MKNKKYYRSAIQMAWPSVLESFFIALAGMIDTMMVATLGHFAIASIGLTTQPKFLGYTIFFAINVAVSALVARRRGEDDKYGANEVLLTAMTISLLLCAVVTVIAVSFAEDLMRLAGSNAETHSSAVIYFRIIMGAMIFNIVAMCINAAQRASGNTRIAFISNLTSSIINIIFNYLLIGGQFGFPALGVQGAAIATVIGSLVAMLMSIKSLFNKKSLVDFDYMIRKKIKSNLQTAKSIYKLGINMFFENIAMRIGFLTTALTAASLGTSAFAAHNAGMNVLNIGFSFADGMQVAAVALTGRALGKKRPSEAISYGEVCQKIGLAISIVLSILMLAFGKNIMQLFFKDESIIKLGVMITNILTVVVLLQISQIIYGGCLRSGGDVKYTLIAGIISVTIIRTSVTLVLVHIFKLGLMGIWLGILADQFSRFCLMRFRFKKGKWTDIKI